MNKQFRHHILSCAAVLAIAPVQAHAQSANPQAANASRSSGTEEEAIVVTGTRVVQDGYSAPTPVTVLGGAEILAQNPSNIADLVNTLPAMNGGTETPATNSGNISVGTGGLSTVNLRGLGSNRMLVLIDGRRSPPSNFTGLVDINTIPQDLVERVEVVTGGASAQYGSDAVGGVVNFILNKKFEGIKLGADTSITIYGDGPTYRFSATAGLHFLDDRLHILVNGDYFRQDGIEQNDRPWNDRGYAWALNPDYTGTNGQPEYIVGSGIGVTRTEGGLINSGPLRGTYFLGEGVTGRFNYGATNAVSAPWMIGGDWRLSLEGVVGTHGLQPTEERAGVFNRVDFDLSPDVNLFGQFSWNRHHVQSGGAGAFPADVSIAADNAFLLTQYPQVAAAMNANGLSSVTVRNWNPSLPFIGVNNTRQTYRYLAGARGKFSMFDSPWHWEVYYQKGISESRVQTANNYMRSRMSLATDAVISNGQIVCRSTLADPTNGCVPMDRLGTGAPSDAALAYIMGPEQPWRRETFTQDNVSASLSGRLFELPGGPLAVALGADWRQDQVDSRLGEPSGYSGWAVGNYRPNSGKLSVGEGFLEAVMPLFTGFSLDVAGRITDYSAVGTVGTWKAGATYSPIPDVKFRGSYSHDIRAPNLSELFTVGSSVLYPQIVLPANSPAPGVHINVFAITQGNPNLKPEKADSWTAGVVLQPRFLPGFSASFDLWDTKVRGAIGNSGSSVDNCYGRGLTQFCDNLIFSGNQLTAILSQPVNIGSQHVRGFDIEASYSAPMSQFLANLPGNFRIHAMATHLITNVSDNLIAPPIESAGAIRDGDWADGAQPRWRYRVSAFYDLDRLSVNLVARGFGGGVYDNSFISCTSGCPTSTPDHRTISDNDIKGSLYFDGSVSVKIPSVGNDARLSLNVYNIFNKYPTPIGIEPFANALGYPKPSGHSTTPSAVCSNYPYHQDVIVFKGWQYLLPPPPRGRLKILPRPDKSVLTWTIGFKYRRT